MPEEQRLKMVGIRPEAALAARAGKPLSAEHRAAISAANKRLAANCSVKGCGDLPQANDMCPKHYWRWKRHGDPLFEEARVYPVRDEAFNWRGDDVGYDAVHVRMKQMLPTVCALADETCKGRLEVAFRSHDTPEELWRYHESRRGRVPFSTDPDHYWRLCRSHHVRLDHGLLGL